MLESIKQCKNCKPTPRTYSSFKFDESDKEYLIFWTEFIDGKRLKSYGKNDSYNQDFENNICPFCKCELIDTMLTHNDFRAIGEYSNYNRDLLLAMIELRKKDVIEFEAKMQPFRESLKKKQDEEEKRRQHYLAHKDDPRCPKCGSSNIQMVQRKWSLLTGFMTNKVDRVCANCKTRF